MSTTNTAGPAFPQNAEQFHFHPGMTLRDYFAAKAMQGWMVGVKEPNVGVIAGIAYKIADAMLEARK